MTPDVLMAQLLATQAAAEALALSCRALRVALTAATDAPVPDPVAPSEPAAGPVCDHPAASREPAPRMGYMRAFYCRACNQEVLTP